MEQQTQSREGQKMGSVMFTSRIASEFKPRRTTARSLPFALGLTILFCNVMAVQGGIAQATSQNSNARDSTQAPSQSSGTNTSDNGDQGTGGNGDQGRAQKGRARGFNWKSPPDGRANPLFDEDFG